MEKKIKVRGNFALNQKGGAQGTKKGKKGYNRKQEKQKFRKEAC